MADLFSAVSTTYTHKIPDERAESFLTEVKVDKPLQRSPTTIRRPETPQEALETLKTEPGIDSLTITLNYLKDGDSSFSIQSPGPLAAQLVHVLVSETLPNYWNVLQPSENEKSARKGAKKSSSNAGVLLSCLRNVTGLNAILLNLKQFIQQSKEAKTDIGGSNIQDTLETLLQVLSELVKGSKFVEEISRGIWNAPENHSKQRSLWHEFLNIIGGKIMGISAEAEDVINKLNKEVGGNYWISNGRLYSKWLASNISSWANSPALDDNGEKHCAEVLGKSFRLGHTDVIVKELLASLVLQVQGSSKTLQPLLDHLPVFEQRNFVLGSLRVISNEYLSTAATREDDSAWWQADADLISASSSLITLIIAGEESRKTQLIVWLTGTSGAGIGDGIAIRRAAIAAIAQIGTDIETVLEKGLQQFGDQLYIRHTPTLQQEVHAQVLLLSAGYVHRKIPLSLGKMMRAGAYLSLVSNRLATSSPRARLLGMIVGEALSGLVDTGDKKMDFKIEETNTQEAKWYKSLVMVSDTVGSLDVLRSGRAIKVLEKQRILSTRPPARPQSVQTGLKVIAIEEVDDEVSEEEISDGDGLIPFAKPDYDEEDSDEDATLITRNKPTAPVYIRDLITYLRDTENYDKQKLGLQTAAPLIRRKANFGTEVSSHAEELATLLVGLQDKYDLENFADMRLQGMIAVLVALPLKMGQWFSKTFFDGDYSLSQRASVLTTLGLGTRELGGLGSEKTSPGSDNPLPSSSFPSKALPGKMHKLYAPSTPSDSIVDDLSTQLINTMIAPMAASLADKLAGPSILKVRTFSTRMAVEKRRKKPIANALAKIVADGFFFPLTGRFFIHLKAFGPSSRSNVVFQPYLLTLFIKTLALLIHASGPSTLSLPQLTSEFWYLLLSLRAQSIGDITVIEALLFGFLTILEINEDKRTLVESHGRQMLETQEWVEGVFGRVGAGGGEEDEKVRMLAAGCLVRIREVVEKYQALLMGDLASFQT